MEWLIEKLLSLIPALANLSKEKREVADNAIIAISAALNETQLYMKHVRRIGKSDRTREETLSRYWAAAAVPARHLDVELAEMCLYKSEFWIDPDEWDRDKIAQYGLSIDTVKDKYRELLHSA